MAWLLIPTAITLSACTGADAELEGRPETALPTPTPTTTFTDLDGFAEEYTSAAERLADSLPAGRDFPATPPGEWEAEGNFEEGTGEVAAALQWRCEWLSAYVIAAESARPDDAEVALDQLAEWGNLREVRDHSDGETRTMWLERVVETARSGDDSALRAIQAECLPQPK
ncbi:hypothetical protein ACTJKH_07280 [Microbacterium sp. 22215]|uniref:hypothetical protein n=1 Tax=Microbacterium sp. 22215 TaxID=3453893 RepID=UPI003F825A67